MELEVPSMSDQRLSRRTFLTLSAAGAAGAALGAAGRARSALAAPHPGDPRLPQPPVVALGVASYSLRNFPRARAIEMVKALGMRYVNFKSVHVPYDLSAAELALARQEIETAGLVIVGGGVITFDSDRDDDVRKYFAYAKTAGMPLITATGDPTLLPRIERFAKQYDIQVAIHNHGPEDKHFPSPYDVLRKVKDLDRRIGLCMDVGHTARTGTDVVRAIADAGPRLLDMHMKDLRDRAAVESQCIVGEGTIPIAAIFRQLEAIGYRGYVNLEYEIDPDAPLPGMKQSLAYMRGGLAGLAAGRCP
jgi:sugar phosphate isomerase/epimerase